MKREDISKIFEGATDEQITAILNINGADIEKAKGGLADKTAELEAANKTIADLQAAVKKFDGVDVDGLNQQIADLNAKYENDTAALRLDSALNMALVGAKAKNPKLAKAALDISVIKLDGDKLLGFEEQLEKLKESDGYLFDDTPVNVVARVDTSAGHNPGNIEAAPQTLQAALAEHYK